MPAAWLGPGGPGAGCASLRPRALRPRWSWCGGHRLQARRVLGGGGSAAAAPRKHSFKASTFVAKSSKRTTQKLTSDGGRKQPRLQHSQQRTHKVGRKQPQRRAQLYFNFTFFPFPLGPLLYRRTIRYTVDPGWLWCFEQEQSLAFTGVTTNIRMTVIRLQSDCLWVHAPVAPTRECVALVKELGLPVGHIVLPTFAYEHKIFVGPFSRAFPRAQVHIAPRQWSLPISLPVQFFGIFPTSVLQDGDTTTVWADEIKQKVFASSVGAGPYTEVAFFHKRSRTLLVTDAVIHVPAAAPEPCPRVPHDKRFLGQIVCESDLLVAGGPLPASVLTLSSGGEPEPAARKANVAATSGRKAVMQRGWMRMVLQILYFVPGNLLRPQAGFEAIAGRLLVSPVLQKLVFSNAPAEARRWVDEISQEWSFQRVIPAHFAGPVQARPADLRAAFSFVYGDGDGTAGRKGGNGRGLWVWMSAALGQPRSAELPLSDMRTLDGLARLLRKAGALE